MITIGDTGDLMVHKFEDEVAKKDIGLMYGEYSYKEVRSIAKKLGGKYPESKFIVEPHSYHKDSWIILRIRK
jgi:hypothetical protein